MARSPDEGCYEKALELIARRPHFRRQLATKLAARGFSSSAIDSTLERLARQGLVDDQQHARALATGSMARKGFGPRRVRAELLRRGVDDDCAETVVAEVFSDLADELARARELVRDWRRLGRGSDEKLARHLDRKGYTKVAIVRLLEESREE